MITARYVAGFAFNMDGDRVLLVLKKKPAWQNGRLNAIGGKIEANESPLQAMVREFREETDVQRCRMAQVLRVARQLA